MRDFFEKYIYGCKWLPDSIYLQWYYWHRTGKKLNLKNPKTYNEKLQWLKLHDRKANYSKLVDKYNVKKIVEQKIGSQYIIPTLGIWESFDDIDFDTLPERFVLKCTHDSGSVIICKDKKLFNRKAAREVLQNALKKNYYWYGREWPYKNVRPRIIAEKYMVDESGVELKDYKFFCFNGIPKLIQVDYDRYKKHKRNLYTTEWKYVNVAIEYPTDRKKIIEKPQVLTEMLELSKILSQGIPHVRVDFYVIYNQIYFGELTFYHGSGGEKFTPIKYEKVMGDWIDLPNRKDRINGEKFIQHKNNKKGGNKVSF